jgi:PAS domain S-box-containing protein
VTDGVGTPVERALRTQLEAAESIAHIGSWEWTVATGAVTWSDELYRIYGLEPGAVPITLEYFLSRIHAGERERIQREIQGVLARPGRFAYRELIVRPDGSVRTLDTIGKAVTDEHGAVIALVGTCRDITEHAEREVQIEFYADVFEHVQIGLSAWQLDGDLRLVAFNPATERIMARPLGGQLGQRMLALWPALATTPIAELARAVADGAHVLGVSPFRIGDGPMLAATLFALPRQHVGMAVEDISVQVSAQVIQAGERRALEMLAASAPLTEILAVIVRAIEETSVGTIASILLLDETGTRLRHGAAPRLPEAYTKAVDGVAIGPRAGSCGTAMYRRAPVFVSDVEVDPLWTDFVHLLRPYALRACWSHPILATDGHVLGTFALYRREPGLPDAATTNVMERAAHVAGIVLERRALDEQMRALATRIEAIREDERTTIARDIHDQLGQALTVLKLDLGWLQRRIDDEALGAKLREMARSSDDLIATVRRISADLRPGILDDVGLRAAIEWQAEEFAKRTGTRCTVKSSLGDVQLDRALATAVFRIFQESLTNIARHASAKLVEVSLEFDRGQLRLEVSDDGVGLPEVGPRGTTLGILGMGERARRLGGECTVRRRAPRGTVVTLVVPLRFPAERTAGR